jgi:hypothetical protein
MWMDYYRSRVSAAFIIHFVICVKLWLIKKTYIKCIDLTILQHLFIYASFVNFWVHKQYWSTEVAMDYVYVELL